MLRADFFRTKMIEAEATIQGDSILARCLGNLSITNIVATANLSVNDINLGKLAQRHFFCNYHKCTFAAMGIRLHGGSAALLYSMGVMVCMGTNSTTGAMVACTKYCQILNSQLKINCHITGFQVDNYVCTILTFTLDLNACIRGDWATVIEYDKEKFPGAAVRCKFMDLDFATDVVMEFFESGKINITGAKSIYEARYMFLLVYFRYLVHIRVDRDGYKRKRTLDLKNEPIFDTDMVVPKINTNVEAMRKYRASSAINVTKNKVASFSRVQTDTGDDMYVDQDGKPMDIDSRYKDMPFEDIDRMIMAIGMKADF